jgi:hypothetical protein
VTFLLDQASQSLQVDKPIRGSASCDALAAQATAAGLFVPEGDVDPDKLATGSIFLVRDTPTDWTHTGIVVEALEETFSTIEGNTNDAGHHEGVEVCARSRGYAKKDFVTF